MALVNYSSRELTAKLVYYGPGLCGKTTNLQYIYAHLLPDDRRSKMVSLATETDRTLFFDFLPLDIGTIRGLKTRLQLYTVPGQVHYNATRKIVLKGADGIVFVADSQQSMRQANIDSFNNMKENLTEHGLDLSQIPHVIQLNKRDLPNVMPIEQMIEDLNEHNAPFWESVAIEGIGVEDTLKGLSKLVLKGLATKFKDEAAAQEVEGGAPAADAAPIDAPLATPEAAPPMAAEPVVPEAPAEAEILEVDDGAVLLDDDAPLAEAEPAAIEIEPEPVTSLEDVLASPAEPPIAQALAAADTVIVPVEDPDPLGAPAAPAAAAAAADPLGAMDSPFGEPEPAPVAEAPLEVEADPLGSSSDNLLDLSASSDVGDETILHAGPLATEGFGGGPLSAEPLSGSLPPAEPPPPIVEPAAPVADPLTPSPTVEPLAPAAASAGASEVSVPLSLGAVQPGQQVERDLVVPVTYRDASGTERMTQLKVRLSFRLD